MSLADRAKPEGKRTYAKAEKEHEPLVEDEFDRLLRAEDAKWHNPEQDLDKLVPQLDGLVALAANEQYPRKNVPIEDAFMMRRRERATRVLMDTGNREYVEHITNLLRAFDDVDNIEAEGTELIKKLGTFGADAAMLITWLASLQLLVGSGKQEGLLQIQLDKVYYDKQEEALKSIVAMQADMPAGFEKDGKVKHLSPSSMLISSEMVKGWIIKNVPEYQELRKDIAVLTAIFDTLNRLRYQLNGSADNITSLLNQYPRPMLGN